MASLVDIIIAVWFLFLLSSGWRKGLLRTLVGPLSLIISAASCSFYFQETHNFIGVIAGMFLGPVVVSMALSLLISLWHININKGVPPEFFSRLSGSVCNLFWGAGIAVSTLLAVAIIPAGSPRISALKTRVTSSYAYKLTEALVKDKIPLIEQAETVIKTSQNPQEMAKFQSQPEFLALYYDRKIQKLLSDKETLDQIQNRNIKSLFSNPTFLALWQDPELLTKMMELSKRIAEAKSPSRAPSSQPKVYKVK